LIRVWHGAELAWKYLFPGVAGMLLFVAFPLLYTVQIGFTNYSSSNLLEEERARAYLLDQRWPTKPARAPSRCMPKAVRTASV
jgi:ABC-type sugar transport system permease subunit